MKITRRQLKQIIKEGFTTVSDEEFDKITMPGYKGPQPGEYAYLDSIDSQKMADAKRAVGEDPAAQAAHLGISVDDWHTIRQELDDHYEDRHMEDQMAFDDDPDLDDDGMLSVGELVKMTQNIAADVNESKIKITRRQLRKIIREAVISESLMYSSPLTYMINQILERESLPYRAMVGSEWLTSAFLAPSSAEGPVEEEFESQEAADLVVEKVVKLFPIPGLSGEVEQKEGSFSRNWEKPVFVVSFSLVMG